MANGGAAECEPSDLTTDEVERLIEAVRERECLYDVGPLDYRDSKRKKNAWESVRFACGMKSGKLTILRFTFSPSAADTRSNPSQSTVERVSCDLELSVCPCPTGRSRDFLPAVDRLGWPVASTALRLRWNGV
ncbi:uncharacterized protein ISCGN_006799 [Ixodes scapularis]